MRAFSVRTIGWSGAVAAAALLAACHSSPSDTGTITHSEARQLDEAATMLDANSVDANAVDMNASDQEQPQ